MSNNNDGRERERSRLAWRAKGSLKKAEWMLKAHDVWASPGPLILIRFNSIYFLIWVFSLFLIIIFHFISVSFMRTRHWVPGQHRKLPVLLRPILRG